SGEVVDARLEVDEQLRVVIDLLPFPPLLPFPCLSCFLPYSITVVQSPRRINGSGTPSARRPSTSRADEPIMKSTCTALRLPPALSNSSLFIVSPPASVKL